MPAIQSPDNPDTRDDRALIAHLLQSVQAWMDGDQVLPADGSSLLALLERVMEGLSVRNAPPASLRSCARTEIEAFIRRVQALIDAGVLDVAAGGPLIEAAAPVRGWLPSAGGTGSEPRSEPDGAALG